MHILNDYDELAQAAGKDTWLTILAKLMQGIRGRLPRDSTVRARLICDFWARDLHQKVNRFEGRDTRAIALLQFLLAAFLEEDDDGAGESTGGCFAGTES